MFNLGLGASGFKQQPRHNFTFYVFRLTGSLVPLEIGIIKSSLNMRLWMILSCVARLRYWVLIIDHPALILMGR